MAALSPLQWLGIGLLLAYGLWLTLFFGRVRPRLMAALGRRLRLSLAESLDPEDAGAYTIAGGQANPATHVHVSLLDLVLLLLGTVGVAAIVFVPAFLVAESGVLLPFEGRLTGRRVALELEPHVRMRAAAGEATLAATARNDGARAETNCRLSVAGYSAANGYLTGSSRFFELAPGARRRIDVALHALRPVPGAHTERIELECGATRLAVARTSVEVAP